MTDRGAEGERRSTGEATVGIGTNNEAKRIAEVYERYREDKCVANRWSRENPGNKLMLLERRLLMRKSLEAKGYFPLADKVILDIGCGHGGELSNFLDWGARAENLFGVDLLPERIDVARLNLPDVQLDCRNAESLHFRDNLFDIILLFTVFSSIIEDAMARRIAAETLRVLKPGGAIVWYDMRYDNPFNPHIRGIKRKDLHVYFENLEKEVVSVTPIPPLVRRLGILLPVLYPALRKMSVLHTHYFGLFRKSAAEL